MARKTKKSKPTGIVAYKGFDKDFRCRGFQYEVGKTYEHQGAATASGARGKARGIEGTALFLVHRDDDGNITHAKAEIVGRNGIKPGVWYALDKTGAFVEA